MQPTKAISIFGASGLVAGALLAVSAPDVHAIFYAALPASTCMAEWLDYGHVYNTPGEPQMWLTSNLSNAYVCPVVDNSNIQHKNLNVIQVRVSKQSATTNPYARACVWLPGSVTGGSCGTQSAGDGTLTPSLSVITNATYANYTAYLYVYLPNGSHLYDLYFEDS